MSSYLIIGLPRTGTTILNALLCEEFNCWDLNEHWQVNAKDKDIRNFDDNLPVLSVEQKSRIEYLTTNKDKNWALKVWSNHFILQKKSFEELLKSDVVVLMTNRVNIDEHFNSWINAFYRSQQFNLKSYHYTNKSSDRIRYKEIDISEEEIISFYNFYVNYLINWRMSYEICKEKAIVLSYENEIKPYNLQKIGIKEETVRKYFSKETHFVPTPFNVTKVASKKVYSECLNLLDNYKYLVEI